MDHATPDKEFKGRMQKLEALLTDLQSHPDLTVRSKMSQAVQSLMDFHGEGIGRMLDHLHAEGESGDAMIGKLADDELVSSMLLLYGMHPLDLETRIGQALEKVRPYMHSHGGNVELLSITDGVVRLRMQGSCHGCPSSTATLKSTIEEAVLEKAPDVVELIVEGVVPAPTALPASGFVPLERLTTHAKPRQGVDHENLQVVGA